MQEFKEHKIRFLCACDMISEGWDYPELGILVMARPTLSKVLYLQQIGRGLRRTSIKKNVFVIDVVDEYGAVVRPCSMHAIFGNSLYVPFGDITRQDYLPGQMIEIDGITERVERIVEVDIHTEELDNQIGAQLADKLRGELELIDGVYPEFDKEEYLKGELAPVFFGSALNNFGVQELLDCFVEIAPSPRPVKAEEREVEPGEPKFTGFIFKITANIDPNHRSCIAFCKICSGKFVRNAPYLHVRHGKTMRFSSPTQFMAQRKTTVDEAWAGDIIGLPDNGTFKIGDTLTEGEALHFKGLPSFSPEMFKYIENADPMKQKQLAKGIDQLMDEGVAQLFVNQFNGRKIIGTVGQLQFEVIQYRLENEYSAKCRWEPLSLYKACWIESDDAAELEAFKKRKYQYMAKDREGRDVFLADSGYVLQMAQMDFKHIKFHFTSEF